MNYATVFDKKIVITHFFSKMAKDKTKTSDAATDKDGTAKKEEVANSEQTSDLPYYIASAAKIYKRQHDIINSSNGIFVNKRIGKISEWVKISNFPIIPKRFVKVDDEKTFRLLQIGNDAEIDGTEPNVIKVNSECYVSVDRLKKALSHIDKQFIGITQKDLDLLTVMYEGMQPTEQVKVGFNPGAKAMFFNNVAVKDNKVYSPDKLGIVDIEGKSYFMPTIIKKTSGNLDRYTYSDTQKITFNDWFKLLYTGWGDRAVLPVCFAIMSVFRDIVDRNSLFIPPLYVKGEKGSGKSTLISNITKIYGAAQKEKNLMAENTPKSIARNMSQVDGSMIWYNEYHNSMPEDYKNLPQYIYDKAGYERAKYDNTNEVDSIEVNSTLCLTSNYTPDNEIVYSRLIFVKIDKAKHSEAQINAVNQLAEYKNLSCICCELQQYFDLVDANFDKTKKELFTTLYGYFESIGMEVDTRYIDNMSVVLTPAYILLKHKKISFGFDADEMPELMEVGSNNIKTQLDNFNGNSAVNTFWTTIQILFEKWDIKKEYHVKLVDAKIDGYEGKRKLAIRTNELISQYRKYCGNDAKSTQDIRDALQQINPFISVWPVKFITNGDAGQKKEITYTQSFVFDYDKLISEYNVDFGF